MYRVSREQFVEHLSGPKIFRTKVTVKN